MNFFFGGVEEFIKEEGFLQMFLFPIKAPDVY